MLVIAKLLLIFAAGVIIDITIAAYTLAVADRRPLCAANYSALLAFLNLVVLAAIWSWIDSGLYLVPAYAAGNWLGTYLITRASRRALWRVKGW